MRMHFPCGLASGACAVAQYLLVVYSFMKIKSAGRLNLEFRLFGGIFRSGGRLGGIVDSLQGLPCHRPHTLE